MVPDRIGFYKLLICNNCGKHFFVQYTRRETDSETKKGKFYTLTLKSLWNRNRFKR